MELDDVTALHVLLAGTLLVYGVLHGLLVAWIWRNHEDKLIPTLLLISPFGVGLSILASVPFVGWFAALIVAAALGFGFVPVAAIVGFAYLHRKDGLR